MTFYYRVANLFREFDAQMGAGFRMEKENGARRSKLQMKRPLLIQTEDPRCVFGINQRDFKAAASRSAVIGTEGDTDSDVASGFVFRFNRKPESPCAKPERTGPGRPRRASEKQSFEMNHG